MAAGDEQVELLVSDDTHGHANSSTSSRAAVHHRHNLIDFDAKYGRKADANVTSLLSSVRGMSCKCEQVLNCIERHVPAVNLIQTYKVCNRLTVILCIIYNISLYLFA